MGCSSRTVALARTWPLRTATERLQRAGHRVGHAQLRYLNPFPRNLGEVLRAFGVTDVDEQRVDDLNRTWHRLSPWPDSVTI